MPDKEPSTHGGNGDQRPDGKFSNGNKLGKGNPLAGRAAKIRAVLFKQMTPKATEKVCKKLIAMAVGGDLSAIKELLDRTMGKPSMSVELSGSGGGPVKTETEVKHVVDYDKLREDLERLASDRQVGGRISENDNGKPVHSGNSD